MLALKHETFQSFNLFFDMGFCGRKLNFVICEQQNSRSTCTSMQSDLHLCYSFSSYHIIIIFLINAQVQGHHPLPGNWLAAHLADLTPDLQVLLSCGSTVMSFHARQSFSISFIHVSLGIPAPACHQSVYHMLF